MSQAIPADAAAADDPGGAPLRTVPAAPRAGGPGPLATLVPMDNLGARLKELRQAGRALPARARPAGRGVPVAGLPDRERQVPALGLDPLHASPGCSTSAWTSCSTPTSTAGGAAAGRGRRPARHDPANAWHPSEYATRISVVHPVAPRAPADGRGRRLGAAGRHPGAGRQLHEDHLRARARPATRDGTLITHEGYEYGYVLAGMVEVTVGNEVFVLHAGESLGFDSTHPAHPAQRRRHRLPGALVRPRQRALTRSRTALPIRWARHCCSDSC